MLPKQDQKTGSWSWLPREPLPDGQRWAGPGRAHCPLHLASWGHPKDLGDRQGCLRVPGLLSTPTGTKARCQPGARAVRGPGAAPLGSGHVQLSRSGPLRPRPRHSRGRREGGQMWGGGGTPQSLSRAGSCPSSLGSRETRSRWPCPLTLGSGPLPRTVGTSGEPEVGTGPGREWRRGRGGSTQRTAGRGVGPHCPGWGSAPADGGCCSPASRPGWLCGCLW